LKSISRSLSELRHVSKESALKYSEAGESLLGSVNGAMARALLTRPLIGGAAPNVMYDNHKNHHGMMTSIFRYNKFALLAKIVPWVYRAYGSHGFQAEYFPELFRAWIAAISDVLPGETSEELLPVYRWLLEHDGEFRKSATGPLVPTVSCEGGGAKAGLWRHYLEALLRCDARTVTSMTLDHGPDASSVRWFYRCVVQPALYEVGTLWEEGKISVAEEHAASALVFRAMAGQYLQLAVPEPTKGKALVSAAQNEQHELGAWMVANSLELDGWNVVYVGANTPRDSLLSMARQMKPDVLALSVGMPFNVMGAEDFIRRVKQDDSLENCRVLVGGLAFHHFPELTETIGADAYASGCDDAVRVAGTWWNEASA